MGNSLSLTSSGSHGRPCVTLLPSEDLQPPVHLPSPCKTPSLESLVSGYLAQRGPSPCGKKKEKYCITKFVLFRSPRRVEMVALPKLTKLIGAVCAAESQLGNVFSCQQVTPKVGFAIMCLLVGDQGCCKGLIGNLGVLLATHNTRDYQEASQQQLPRTSYSPFEFYIHDFIHLHLNLSILFALTTQLLLYFILSVIHSMNQILFH